VPELPAEDARTQSKRALWMGKPAEHSANIHGAPADDYEDALIASARTLRTLTRTEQPARQNMHVAFSTSETCSISRDIHLSPGSPALGTSIGLPVTSGLDEEKAARSASRRAQFINSGLPPPSPPTSSAAAVDPSPKGKAVESDVLKRCQVSEQALPPRIELLRFSICKMINVVRSDHVGLTAPQNLLMRSKEQSKKLLEDVAWPVTPEGQARAAYAIPGPSMADSHTPRSVAKESVPFSSHSNNRMSFESPDKRVPYYEHRYPSPHARSIRHDETHSLRHPTAGHVGNPAMMGQGMWDMGRVGGVRAPSPARTPNSVGLRHTSPSRPMTDRDAPQLLTRNSSPNVVFM